ncbi:MAG: flippase-like domain-containing protein, partial [Alphaproteobacteria bacterium]|nr:flippase-like domain-containing protein [Alphaproteobacteria bacterium]
AAISGGAIRYRLYTRWRIRGGDIFKMLTLSGLTYFLGVAAIVVVGYFLIPHDTVAQSAGLSMGLGWLFGICLALILTYFLVTIIFQKKSIKIGNLLFQVPTPKTATLQILLGITDSVLAGLVLYFCLTPFVSIPFGTFIGLFVIAQATGIFSQVPGGIGVFETIFLAALPDTVDKASVFGALLAYRVIYYVLPLIGVGGLFFIYERWLRSKMKQWAAQAKQEITQIQQKIKNTAKKVRKTNKK